MLYESEWQPIRVPSKKKDCGTWDVSKGEKLSIPKECPVCEQPLKVLGCEEDAIDLIDEPCQHFYTWDKVRLWAQNFTPAVSYGGNCSKCREYYPHAEIKAGQPLVCWACKNGWHHVST